MSEERRELDFPLEQVGGALERAARGLGWLVMHVDREGGTLELGRPRLLRGHERLEVRLEALPGLRTAAVVSTARPTKSTRRLWEAVAELLD